MMIHDLYRPIFGYFRSWHMRALEQHFGITAETRIFDVGGGSFNGSLLPVKPQITLLKLFLPSRS